ncbi:hypothetical protein ABT095_03450 [Kitasatospora sp. NPDC002227]|uniref:hypothetical protein n=1 Tax=Kitasatospora sp. NPDC002227 TaxID=3154773 RepID=UPI00332937D9
MPSTETSPRREYAAATEWLAGRALDALIGAGGPALLLDTPDAPAHRALLAAAHVLGPDLLAPALLAGRPPDPATTKLAAEAHQVFAAADPAAPPAAALVRAWRGWTTAGLLARAGHAGPAELPSGPPDDPAWARWSQPMAQLSPLALPGLDSPVHLLARQRALDLARGATRAALRRDHRTALRLARWLAWLGPADCPLDLPPLLSHLTLTGDGTPRSALDLALCRALGGPR